MRQTASLSFALLLASGLFSAGGIAAPHRSSNGLVQRDVSILDEHLANLGPQPRDAQSGVDARPGEIQNPSGTSADPAETDDNTTSTGTSTDDNTTGENTTDQSTTGTALLKTLKRFVNTILGRAVSGGEGQADIVSRDNTVSGNVARDAGSGAHHARTVRKTVVMGRQFLNETTPTNETETETETETDPDVVLSRRNSAGRSTVLFQRQFINGTTPTNRTVSERAVVVSRDGGSAPAHQGRGLVVRTAVVLPRQFTNGTGNGTDVEF